MTGVGSQDDRGRFSVTFRAGDDRGRFSAACRDAAEKRKVTENRPNVTKLRDALVSP